MTSSWPELLNRIHDVADELRFVVTHRPMFGGAMVDADERPIASLSHAGLAVKVSGEHRAELLAAAGTAPLRYSPDSPASRTYVVLTPAIVADDDLLAHWLNTAATQPAAGRSSPRRRSARSS